MKCAKCGAELRLGCIYCSVCGQEAQIVSDSKLLEEEFLSDLLKEETVVTKQPEQKKTRKKKKKSYKALIISLCFLVTAMVIGILFLLNIKKRNENSYDYQIQKAQEYYTEKNYVKALEYYTHALELMEQDLSVRYAMVDIYIRMEDDKSALNLLHEIITMAPLEKKAYELLITLYDEKKAYDEILKLKETVKDDELKELFSSYEATPPLFSMESGTYPEYITIELRAEEGLKIYYTTDGSNPIENGIEYVAPFEMKEQKTLAIRAVSCNEYGIYSNIVTGTFTVKFQKPKMPIAIPDRGTFVEPKTVELFGVEGSTIYYTWDGSDPTPASAKYTEPLYIPEGDNILSVILVNKYGMVSDVLKCNYKYLP